LVRIKRANHSRSTPYDTPLTARDARPNHRDDEKIGPREITGTFDYRDDAQMKRERV